MYRDHALLVELNILIFRIGLPMLGGYYSPIAIPALVYWIYSTFTALVNIVLIKFQNSS